VRHSADLSVPGPALVVHAVDAALRALIERELAPPPPAIVTADPAGIAALRAAHPLASIVVVGISRAQLAAALDAGADAAIAGPPRPHELRARLHAVARRRRPPLRVGPLELEPFNRVARIDGAALELGPREFDVLSCLASAPGRVFTKGQLAHRCWESVPNPAGRAVERCLARLRARLGRHASLLVTVWGVGYRLGEPG